MRVERYFKATNHIISEAELFNKAHKVRTFGGDIYINHQNGTFVEIGGRHTMNLSEIYPLISKVFATDRRLIGKRRNIESSLKAGHEVRKDKHGYKRVS